MYTLKVFIVVVAFACGDARYIPEQDDNGSPIKTRPREMEMVDEKTGNGVKTQKHGNSNGLQKMINALRPPVNNREIGDMSILPLTTTPSPRMPTVLRKVFKQGSWLPHYNVPDYILRAEISSTTPETYLDTDEKGQGPVLRRMEGDTSEDTNEVMDSNEFIPRWIFSDAFIDDDVKEEVLRSFLAETMERESNNIENSILKRPEGDTAENNAKAGLINTDGETMTFAAKPDEDGFYDFNSADYDNVTELWIMEEATVDGLDLDRVIRQGGQDPQSKGLVSNEVGPLRAAFSTENMNGAAHTSNHRTTKNHYEELYNLPLLIAVCVAFTVAIVGFVFGWSAMDRKAQAAAEVDYPAYGVTGPSVVSTGDRRLAHSAHIYHYQHKKQQIIAMEKPDPETRPESVSDPESEDNDEGDYTVYECPGLATTGEMEVKNPMFNDEPTPGMSGIELPKAEE